MLNEIIEDNLKELTDLELVKECLEIRYYLSSTNYATKNKFEKNEVSLLKFKTLVELNKINAAIAIANERLQESFGMYVEEIEFTEKYGE